MTAKHDSKKADRPGRIHVVSSMKEAEEIADALASGDAEDRPAPSASTSPHAGAPAPASEGPDRARLEDLTEQLQRARADLINYRNRIQRERETWGAEARRGLLADLLPVADNLVRALAAAERPLAPAADPVGERKAMIEGMRLVEAMLRKALAAHEVTPIDAAGQPFDPGLHEACLVEEATEVPAGTILEVFETGYRQGEHVLRPARVKVARAPEPAPEATPTGEDVVSPPPHPPTT